ncbi:MAG: TlpA disulfide reductase family protein [Pyrinomonadaceae bacterium]
MRILSVLITLVCLAVCVFGQQNLRIGSPAPVFATQDLDGNSVDLSTLRGRVVVVSFWSTRCGVCDDEIPKLNRLAHRFKDKDVVFLGLTMENRTRVESYLSRQPFNFNILTDSFGIVLRYADRDHRGYVNISFPAHYIVDQAGNIAMRTSGYARMSSIESNLSRLLSKQPSAASMAVGSTR